MIKKNKKVTNNGVRGAQDGGITTQEAPIHVSNVQLVDPETKRPARVGLQDQLGRQEGPRSASEREGNLMATETPARPRLKERYRSEIAAAMKGRVSGTPT